MLIGVHHWSGGLECIEETCDKASEVIECDKNREHLKHCRTQHGKTRILEIQSSIFM